MAETIRGADSPHERNWSQWLRNRGEARRVWVRPGARDRFVSDGRLRHVDVSAVVGLSGRGRGRFYAGAEHFGDLLADDGARVDRAGDLEVTVVPSLPDDVAGLEAPGLLAAGVVDLLESPDAREHHAAEQAMEAAASELADALSRRA